MNAPKLDRSMTEFVTPEGLLTFPFLFPGQAQKSFREGSFAYKIEWVGTIQPTDQIVQVASLVAQTNDQTFGFNPQTGQNEYNWPKHIFGAKGKIKLLHETDRDQSKYGYAQGKHLLTISTVHDAESMKLCNKGEFYDMANPEKRQNFEKALQAQAPKAHKFCNPNDQADLAWIAMENQKRMFNNLAPISDADIPNTLRELMPHEIWSGCYGRVRGRVYWSRNAKPQTIGFALTNVLVTRTGERLTMTDTSPDVAFRAFAPAAELAPPGFVPPNLMPQQPGLAPGLHEGMYPQPVLLQRQPAPFAVPGQQFQVVPNPQPLPPQQQDPWANLR